MQMQYFIASNDESGGKWNFNRPIEPQWKMHYKNLTFLARTSNSRHLGVFPEQATHWDWINEKTISSNRPIKVLNLFGYTGMASLAAAEAGAHVTHIDASKKSIQYARENQQLSGLSEKPIRWIIDDAIKFVKRELRRGIQYDGIILDPPKFGRGPKGEVWEFFEMLPYSAPGSKTHYVSKANISCDHRLCNSCFCTIIALSQYRK